MGRIRTIPLKNIVINDQFWSRYVRLVREKVIPYQWEILNDRVPDAARSHCVKNFEIAAGRRSGEYYGMVFQDSDLYKWLESVAYSLEAHPDPELIRLADCAIELIGAAQQEDGYINTYFTVKSPGKRWTNLQHGHELYCAGHMIEAAVAYYNATGKREFLDIAARFADCIDNTFGEGEGRHRGYPGHEEIELALYKLYMATNEGRYLRLARHFIRIRGGSPYYFDIERQAPEYEDITPELNGFGRNYYQAHMPPVEQRDAQGHAVRAVYLYSAMADLALELGDAALGEACDALYRSISEKRMYITGAIGSCSIGERFSADYDLPPDLVYGETCASIGLMMFSRRMQALRGEARYIDIMERALYNTVISGISLAGTEFFYVNPLESDPARILANPVLGHVKPVRQKWFDCSCCPTNIARTVMGLGGYIYAASDEGLYVNLYCSGTAKDNGRSIEVKTGYPYDGEVVIKANGGKWKLFLRDPKDAPVISLWINGTARELTKDKGYIVLENDWRGDEIRLALDMRPRYVYPSLNVKGSIGKAAIMRGPLVYCAERIDNTAGLAALMLPEKAELNDSPPPDGLPGEAVCLKTRAYRLVEQSDELYSCVPKGIADAEATFIPYHLWANRGENEMRVNILAAPNLPTKAR